MDDLYEMAFWFTPHNRWPVFLFVLHLVFGGVYIWALDVRVTVPTIRVLARDAFFLQFPLLHSTCSQSSGFLK